jgi:hypothetical protein
MSKDCNDLPLLLLALCCCGPAAHQVTGAFWICHQCELASCKPGSIIMLTCIYQLLLLWLLLIR